MIGENADIISFLENARENTDDKKAELKHIISSMEEEKETYNYYKERYENATEAREFIQEVAQKTQQNLEYHINNLVTKAFETIMRHPYEFKSSFVQKRNKTECEFKYIRNGKARSSIGGATKDIASFGMRISYWSLGNTRPTIFLDEPAKWVSKKNLPKFADLIKEVSRELGIQFIIITHIEELKKCADKLFEIDQGKTITPQKEE